MSLLQYSLSSVDFLLKISNAGYLPFIGVRFESRQLAPLAKYELTFEAKTTGEVGK